MKTSPILVLGAAAVLYAQDKPADHHTQVNARGDHAMGFSHDKTTHHFRLLKDGGSIEIQADDQNDSESRNQIREHLKHIAAMFSAGNFDMPMFIHDRVPPGVPVMKKRKAQIQYTFEEMDAGGRVRISSRNPDAVKAIHDFLRFQITDHQTGDPLEITSASGAGNLPAAGNLVCAPRLQEKSTLPLPRLISKSPSSSPFASGSPPPDPTSPSCASQSQSSAPAPCLPAQ